MTMQTKGITGPAKLPFLKEVFKEILFKNRVGITLDVGGTYESYTFLKDFSKNMVVSLNIIKDAVKDCEYPVVGDAQNLPFKKLDLIMATDLIEHLWSPDDFLESTKSCLRAGGVLIITTPNLACWYNRIFLLFGLSLANYHPSLRYRVGNPFLGKFPGEHKSVFTLSALKELLSIYGFKIISVKGYSYGKNVKDQASGRRWRLRNILNKIVPLGMREGFMVVSRKERE